MGMDEVIFRSSQRIENLQIQLGLAASHGKYIFQNFSEQGKSLILQTWNSPRTIQIQETVQQIYYYIISFAQDLKFHITSFGDPKRIYLGLLKIFGRKWTKRDLCFGCAGFVFGSIIGIAIGLTLRKREHVVRYMEAVQCSHYLGTESAVVVEDAIAPYECGENDILINVKAASIHSIDVQICNGYGRYLRNILRGLYEKSKSDLPVVLGRDCTGIVTDIGKNVTRIEIGDEVWLTVPFWSQGTLSQTVLVSELRVSRKPKNVGFEGACSIPYAGCLALTALKRADVTFENAQDKRVLVHGGCTPVGCVLIQILKHWGADVVTTCDARALPVAKALGVDDIILSEPEELIIKELELRDKFDGIIITKSIDIEGLQNYCKSIETCISTLPPEVYTDSSSFIGNWFLHFYIRLKYYLEGITGVSLNEYDEAHMCYTPLDQLAELVENGHLQTVVDKVLQPYDIEIALNHIESPQSIGSTVITFR